MSWFKVMLAKRGLDFFFGKVIPSIKKKIIKPKEKKAPEIKLLEPGQSRCEYCGKEYQSYWDACPYCDHSRKGG